MFEEVEKQISDALETEGLLVSELELAESERNYIYGELWGSANTDLTLCDIENIMVSVFNQYFQDTEIEFLDHHADYGFGFQLFQIKIEANWRV